MTALAQPEGSLAGAGASGSFAAAAAPGPLPFALLLDQAVARARRHFRSIFPSVALPIAVVSAGFQTMQAAWFNPVAAAGADPFTTLARGCGLLLAIVPLLVAMAIAYGAMSYAAVEAVAGRGVEMRRAWRFAVRPAVLATFLLLFVCDVVSFGLCLVPALFVVPLLSLAVPAMVVEGSLGAAALRRSAELTLYNPRRRLLSSPIVRLLALIVVGWLLSNLVTLVFVLPLSLAQALATARAISTGGDPQQAVSVMLWLQVPASFLSSLGSSTVALYMSFALALLFFDARGRREGTDLRQAIDAVAGPAEPAAPPPGRPEP